jgi:hypothetical protein
MDAVMKRTLKEDSWYPGVIAGPCRPVSVERHLREQESREELPWWVATGAVSVSETDTVPSRTYGEGRSCKQCGGTLSRYNPDSICGPHSYSALEREAEARRQRLAPRVPPRPKKGA